MSLVTYVRATSAIFIFLITQSLVPDADLFAQKRNQDSVSTLERMRVLEKSPLTKSDEQLILVDGQIWLRSRGETKFSRGEVTNDVYSHVKERQGELKRLGRDVEQDIVVYLHSEAEKNLFSGIRMNLKPTAMEGFYACRLRKSEIAEISKLGIRYSRFPTHPNPPVRIEESDEKSLDEQEQSVDLDVIFEEDFEGSFPGTAWTVGDENSTNGLDYWDDLSCRYYQGSWSAWCADIGDMTDCTNYDDNMVAYMYNSDPISVAGYNNVQLSYYVWYDTEEGWDYFRRYYSADGINWTLSTHEFSGNSGGWLNKTANPVGFTNYYVKFVFYSDGSINDYEGAYLDNIEVTGDPAPCSPEVLSDGVPLIRSSSPGYYSFNQQSNYWSVVGVRPPSTSDYDLELYDSDCDNTLLASSLYGTGSVDFVVGDHNHSRLGVYYPKVELYSGSGSYTVEWENDADALTVGGTTSTISWGSTTVVKIWDVYLTNGVEYRFTLDISSGTADVGIALFKSNGATYYTGRSSAVISADANGNGSDESFTYTATVTDWYGFVVWGDNAASGSFTISVEEVGSCPMVTALSDGVPLIRSSNPGYYSFNQQQYYWSVVGIRPSTTADYDIELYDDDCYTTVLASSLLGTGSVDFIIGDYNHNRLGAHYPKVDLFSGTGAYTIEWENSDDALVVGGTTDEITWGTNTVVKIWDVYLTSGTTYNFTFDMISGTADVGIALFKSNGATYYAGRSAAVTEADYSGSGDDETITYTATSSDWYGFVVWSNSSASASFTISLVTSDRTIQFAGQEWDVRSSYGGPGPNYWSNDLNSVWIDGLGYLHLKIRYISGIWRCAEVISLESTQYGMHRFYVIGRVDEMDPNVVFSPFVYKDDLNEIDIEFSRWGQPNPINNGQYVVQPYTNPGNLYPFDFSLNGTYSTHYFVWYQDSIRFKSIHGHYEEPPDPNFLIETWRYIGTDIPPQDLGLNVHINLWLVSGIAPTDGEEFEVIIADADLPVTTHAIENSPGVPVSWILSQNFPNPFNPATTITYAVPVASVVRLSVYDLLGRQVASLVDQKHDPGMYEAQWDGTGYASGVYLYRLEAGDFVQTRRLMFLK